MESAEHAFGGLKRRTTDLMNSMPKPSMPNMPNMPNMPTELPQMPQLPQFPSLADLSSKLPKMPAWGPAHPSKPTAQATWERIDVPPLPRSSHSINIVSGNAYIFGGEIEPRKPVDNDMHVIVLPYSSANADYYNVKAKATPRAAPLQIPTVIEPIDEEEATDKGKEKEKDLSDVDLASPGQEPAEVVTGADSIADGPDPSVSKKGKEPARPGADTSALGDVPMARVGHATAVIGNRIFLFGGRGGPEMKPLEECGRVWVFDTKTHLWSYLDPYLPAAEPISPAFADKRQHYPAARSYHSAAGVDLPRDFPAGPGVPPGMKKLKRTSTWSEWAQGDSNMVGTPQQPIVGNIANNSRDEDEDGYGTLIVHGGCFVEGRANDTWAFDVRSRVWQELPSAPGPPRGGTSIAVASSKLWRFGGFNGETEEGGQLDYLELGVDDMAERSSGGGGEIFLSAKGGGWKSLLPEDLPGASPSKVEATATAAATEKGEDDEDDDDAAKPLTEASAPYWPGHRSVAGMQTVTIGGSGGREYLLLALGERDPSNDGHAAAGKFWDDVWAYELPRATAASSVMGAVFGRARSASAAPLGEGKWFRVETEAYDDDDPYAAAGPGPRGWFASAHMGELEERGMVIWGGLDGANKRLGDGWILRMGNEKREP